MTLAEILAAVLIAAFLILAAILLTDRTQTSGPADDADWLDPHATWLPNLSDVDIDAQVNACVAKAHAAYYREVSR